MSLFYKVAYWGGFKPWEHMAMLPIADQISSLFDREERERQPSYGPVLDLGCGSGICSVKLAARGWEVTGVDIVPKALRIARKRALEAGVEVRLIEGDVTALRAVGVGSGFQLVLDFGVVHGLTQTQREAAGREVSAVTAAKATLLMLAWAPARRGLLPRREPSRHSGRLPRMEGDRRGSRQCVRGARIRAESKSALLPTPSRMTGTLPI
jgi:SAM-dependent methyltransferase